MNINGATLTLIGGIISAIGVLISLYGAYKSSNSDEEWQRKMDDKTTTILDIGTDRTKADEALIEIREANFRRELDRNFSNVDIDQIIENAQNLEETGNELEMAKLQKSINKHAELVKIVRPILTVVTEQTVNIINALEKKGVIREKKIQFAVDKDWWLRGSGDLIQAKTNNRKHIFIGYQPSFENGKYMKSARISFGHSITSQVNLEQGFTLPFLDGTTFNIKPKEMNSTENQKLLVAAVTRALNESITVQLGR